MAGGIATLGLFAITYKIFHWKIWENSSNKLFDYFET